MNIRERLGRWLLAGSAGEGAASNEIELRGVNAGARVATWAQDTPQYPDATGRTIERIGLDRNAVLAAGLRQILATYCQASIRVCDRQSDADVPDHPLERLLRLPEPGVPQYLFWHQTLADWYTYGNVFWEVVRGKRTRDPLQLWRLKPSKIALIPGKTRADLRYEYEVDGTWWPIGRGDLIHIRNHSSSDEWFGDSPLLAAVRSLATDNQATDFLKVTLQNLAVPSVAIEVTGTMDPATARELEKKWTREHKGDGLGKATVIGNARVRPIGFSLEQLSFQHLSAYLESRILMAIGGAPLVYLAGGTAAMGANTYSNYGEARTAFIEEVVAPLWNLFDDVISQVLLPQWPGGDRLEAYFDQSEVPGADPARLKRLEAAVGAVSKGLLTREQGLRFAGQNPPAEGEVLYVPTSGDPTVIGPGGTLLPMTDLNPLVSPPSEPGQVADQATSLGSPATQ